MNGIIAWIKSHKLVSLLLIIVIFLLNKDNISPLSLSKSSLDSSSLGSRDMYSVGSSPKMMSSSINEAAPVSNVSNRLVIKDTYLSLQVSKVDDIQSKIIKKAQELGGYMVNSSIENPSDIASATVVVRVPANKLDEALSYYRSLSIKVVSENLQGYDVTDQYTDLEEQLRINTKTKLKFEEMLDKAILVQDILQIQREIISVQASIDSIKGQQDYFKKNAELAKITLYLSTDEIALPYAPSETWRPEVIFKQAVRSMVGTLRNIGSLIIWIGAYALIWLPIVVIIIFLKRRKKSEIRYN